MGAIGAWPWGGLSRILDVLTDIPEIDEVAAIVFGHSRLGNTALWTAAQDPRFAAVVANNSGIGGTALYRHPQSQPIAHITYHFPHWFCKTFESYADEALDRLPVDSHHLLGLAAPRPIHATSSTQDANRPEFLATLYASPVMELYGHRGTLPRGLAAPGATCTRKPRRGERLSFSLREGPHNLFAEDWHHFVNFADENVRSGRCR